MKKSHCFFRKCVNHMKLKEINKIVVDILYIFIAAIFLGIGIARLTTIE